MSRLKKRETWRTHPEFTNYEISNLGRVKRRTAGPGTWIGRILKSNPNGQGYLSVTLCKKGEIKKQRTIHRLVLETFIGFRPENKQCNHKNGIRTKNFLSNLEWVTSSENIIHAIKNGLKIPLKGEECSWSKLKEDEIRLIKKLIAKKVPYRNITKMFKICISTISEIKHEKIWKHINP